MSDHTQKQQNPPSVVHLFRAPVGGLFRHVCDLVRGQEKLGLKLGLICDTTTGDAHADNTLAELESVCELGVYRIPMGRTLGWSDVTTIAKLIRICTGICPDIIHGHGAKGGAYARLIANRIRGRSIYTPHGGSLHYSAGSPIGFVYISLERILRHRTDGIIFESQFGADTYINKVGAIPCAYQVIHNGLNDAEFAPVISNKSHKDFVFVGEIRKLKGLDVLLRAVSQLQLRRNISLLIVGAGPDTDFFQQRITDLGLESCVTLSPAIFPVTHAFAQGKCVVIPSLAESFPYVVLEAAAAKIPLLTTSVGGIPEIFGPYAKYLLPPGDPDALARAMEKMLDAPEQANRHADELQAYVKTHFRITNMIQSVNEFYQQVLVDTAINTGR
jgi:glycosyltransferase involved in cell wall biosynthesis